MPRKSKTEQQAILPIEQREAVSVRTAAVLIDASYHTLRKHIANGSIHVVRLGDKPYITRREIKRILRHGLPKLTVKPKAIAA